MRACGRVLVVDDLPIVARVTGLYLQQLGLATETVHSGAEALQRLEDDPAGFALVVSDVMMPQMSGVELGVRIRRDFPNLPLVLMSGRVDSVRAAELRTLGLPGVLGKPFDVDELRDAVALAAPGLLPKDIEGWAVLGG